jgi:hypothetical protein
MRAGREADVLGAHQGLRDEDVWRGIRLPRRGEVLADPGLREAQLVAQFDVLQVPFIAVA